MRAMSGRRLARVPCSSADSPIGAAASAVTVEASDGTPHVITSAITTPRNVVGLSVYHRPALGHVTGARRALACLTERCRSRALVEVGQLLGDAERLCELDENAECIDRSGRRPVHSDFRRALPLVADALARLAVHVERVTPFRPVTAYTLDHQIVRMITPLDCERVRTKVYDAASRVVAAGPLLRMWETITIDEWDRAVADLAYVAQVVMWLVGEDEPPRLHAGREPGKRASSRRPATSSSGFIASATGNNRRARAPARLHERTAAT